MTSKAFNTLISVSETVFPGISTTAAGANKYSPNSMEYAAIKLGNQLVSNLPLQVLLYLNVVYFPCWLGVTLMVCTVKYHLLNYLYKFVLVTVLVAIVIIEVVRLYLGYLGNLTEKVPELAGFWLLTILLQLPLQGFLLFNTDLILVPIGKSILKNNNKKIKHKIFLRDISWNRDDVDDLVRIVDWIPGSSSHHSPPGKQVSSSTIHGQQHKQS